MKLYISLILLAIALAFATGQYAFLLKGNSNPIIIDSGEFSKLKSDFLEENRPLSVIDFKTLYYSKDYQKLIKPISASVETKGKAEDKTLYYTSELCFENIYRYLNMENYEKVWMWEEFRCRARDKLPPKFFAHPPFIHPTGHSFAFLAFLTGRDEFKVPKWIVDNITYFHVGELPKLKKTIKGDGHGVYDILIDLDESFLNKLFQGRDIILSNHFIFFKLQSYLRGESLKYKVYPKKSLDHFLSKTPYVIFQNEVNGSCLYQEYNLCWKYSPRHLYKLASESTFYFFMGALLIVSLVFWILVNKIRLDKKEEEKRILALRVLTHEFRTPVASMLLQVESVSKNIDHMNPQSQEAVLRLSGDVYRLQRLVEKSRYYLRTEHDKHLFLYNIQQVDSINEFMTSFIQNYVDDGLEINFLPLEKDLTVYFDSYWVGICITNLIENAKNHGIPPIDISLQVSKNYIYITVEDKGVSHFNSMKEMSSPFLKGPDSKGSGLGLNIVQRVAKDMGGDISFKKNPTRFTLKVKTIKQQV